MHKRWLGATRPSWGLY